MRRDVFQLVTCLVASALLYGPASASAGDPPGFYLEANSIGAQLAQAGNAKQAMVELNLEIGANPSAAAYYWRAQCWGSDYAAAISDYTKSIELNPAHAAGAYFQRGLILWRQQKYDRVLEDFSHCLELEPKAANVYSMRAAVWTSKGNHAAARDDYSKAIALDATNSGLFAGRANAESRMGETDKALADYAKAIELAPTNSELFLGRGRVESRMGETEKALADFAKALELDPKNTAAYFSRSSLREKNGDWDGAIADAMKALETNPNDLGAPVEVARIMQRRGDMRGAVLAFSKALELNPKNPFGYYERGCLRYDLGEMDAALADFRKDCEGDVGEDWSEYAHSRIWLIRARRGEKEAASQEVRQYLGSRTTGKPDDWAGKILNFLAGQMSEPAFIKVAEDTYAASDKDTGSKGLLGEAYFYAGSRRLVTGDQEGAKMWLGKCVALDQKNFSEHASAAAELKLLQGQR